MLFLQPAITFTGFKPAGYKPSASTVKSRQLLKNYCKDINEINDKYIVSQWLNATLMLIVNPFQQMYVCLAHHYIVIVIHCQPLYSALFNSNTTQSTATPSNIVRVFGHVIVNIAAMTIIKIFLNASPRGSPKKNFKSEELRITDYALLSQSIINFVQK